MVKSDALTLERSILVNYTSNDTKAIAFFSLNLTKNKKPITFVPFDRVFIEIH